MKVLRMCALIVALAALGCAMSECQTATNGNGLLLYSNSFEQTEIGKVPDGMLVLDGDFAVRQEGTNRFLELPGEPLETFGVVFGPTEKADVVVSARINSTGRGRRTPTFGVGLNGQSGYKLEYFGGKKTARDLQGRCVRGEHAL